MTENVDIIITERGGAAVKRTFDSISTSADSASKSLRILQNGLYVLGGAGIISALQRMSDSLVTMQNRLKLVTDSTAQLNRVQQQLIDISVRTRSDLVTTASLYSRTALSVKALGISQSSSLKFTEQLNKAVILSGSSVREANAAIIQLTQALSSNRLAGDELRSVLEQLPYVAELIAKKMGVTRGELRALGTQGKITAQVILDAVLQADEINQKFAQLTPTIEQALSVLETQFLKVFDALNKTTDFTSKISGSILLVGESLQVVIPLIIAMGTAFVGSRIGTALTSWVKSTVEFSSAIRSGNAILLTNAEITKAKAASSLEAAVSQQRETAATVANTESTLANITADRAKLILIKENLILQQQSTAAILANAKAQQVSNIETTKLLRGISQATGVTGPAIAAQKIQAENARNITALNKELAASNAAIASTQAALLATQNPLNNARNEYNKTLGKSNEATYSAVRANYDLHKATVASQTGLNGLLKSFPILGTIGSGLKTIFNLLGGIPGIIIGSVVAAMLLMKSTTEKIEEASVGLEKQIDKVTEAYKKANGELSAIKSNLKDISVSQAQTDFNTLKSLDENARGRLERTASRGTREAFSLGIEPSKAETDLAKISELIRKGVTDTQQFRRILNEVSSTNLENPTIIKFVNELTELVDVTELSNTKFKESEAVLNAAKGAFSAADEAALQLKVSLGGIADISFNNFDDLLDKLGSFSRNTKEQVKSSQDFLKIETLKEASISELNRLTSLGIVSAKNYRTEYENITKTFEEQVKEIDGTNDKLEENRKALEEQAQAQKTVNERLEEYTLSVNNDPLAERTREIYAAGKSYRALVLEIKEAGLGTEALTLASNNYAKALENIDKKINDDMIDKFRKLIDADLETVKKLEEKSSEYMAGLEREVELAKMTVEQREIELELDKARNAFDVKHGEMLDKNIEKTVRENAKQISNLKSLAAEWTKFSDDLKRSLTDSIVRSFEEGKSAGKVFFESLKRAALTTVIKIPVDFVVNTATAALSGALNSAAGGVGGSIASQIATSLGLKGLGSSLGATFFGKAGVGVAAGAQGAALPATSGLIGTGGFTASYPTLAAAAPYAAAAAAVFTIARATGLIGPKPTVGANAGGFITEQNGQFSIGGIGEDRNKGVSQLAAVKSVLDGTLDVLNDFIKGAGLLDKQVGDGVREAVQLFASGKDPINITVESLTKAMIPFIEGLSDTQRATIAASSGLDGLNQVLTQVLADIQFPAELAAMRKQLENPKQAAIDALNIERDGMVARAKTLTDGTQALLDIEFIYQSRLNEINKEFANQVGESLTSAIDAQKIALTEVDKAFAILSKSVETERKNITNSYEEGLKLAQKSLDNLTESARKLSSITSTLKNALDGLDIQGNEGIDRRNAQAFISNSLNAARNGGAMPDEEMLKSALQVIAKPSENLFTTFEDYQRDFIRTRNDIEDLNNIAAWQLSKANLQIATLQDSMNQDKLIYENEILRLDGILQTAQDQVDAINGTTIAVMSITDAINFLASKLNVATTANSNVGTQSVINDLYTQLLGRAPDKPGAAYWTESLQSGASVLDVTQNIIRSNEFADTAASGGVEGLYYTLLGRAPDAAGLAYWENAFANGQSLQDIALDFTRGQEFQNLPRKANGGWHSGGLVLYGENGPEIGYTPPTMFASNANTRQMLSNDDMIVELRALRQEIAAMRGANEDTARSSRKTSDLLTRVTRDGESMVTVAA